MLVIKIKAHLLNTKVIMADYKGHNGRFWLSYLGPLILFLWLLHYDDFPISRLLSYLVKFISETCRVQYIRYLHFYS